MTLVLDPRGEHAIDPAPPTGREAAVEAALRDSDEEHCRSLVEAMEGGCCLLERCDRGGEAPVDFRYLVANPAFEAQARLTGLVGRTVREVTPAGEQSLLDVYEQVASTGETVRLEGGLTAIGRWVDASIFRVRAAAPARVAVLFSNITERRRLEEALRQAHEQLEARVVARTAELAWANAQLHAEVLERQRSEVAQQALLRQLATAEEEERRRLARDLHDQTGQLLVGLSLAVRAVAAAGPLTPAALGRLDDVQGLADELGKQLHQLAGRLRPTSLDDLGLLAALRQLVTEWSGRSGVTADLQTTGLDTGRLPSEAETVLYRVVQEALTNVAKHAQARQVSVTVSRFGGHATAVIEDDGVGFDPATSGRGRLGLVGMRERVTLAGGQLEIESSPGAGSTLIARLPASPDQRTDDP